MRINLGESEEIDGITVAGVGEATFSVRSDEYGGKAVRTYLALFTPEGGTRVALEVSTTENDARMAFDGARVTLEAIQKARVSR